MKLLAIIGVGVSLFTANLSHAAEIWVDGENLNITGPIVESDQQAIANYWYDNVEMGNHSIKFVRLDSPGGDVTTGLVIAEYIRTAGWATFIPNDAGCASICAVMFSAGVERYMFPGSGVGVHRASRGGLEDNYTLNGATKVMIDEMYRYGTPKSALKKLYATVPGGITWLSKRDLNGWVTWLK